MSSFIQSMSNHHKNTTIGENGSKMYSMDGIDTTSSIKSAFLAAFNGIMENTDNTHIEKYLLSIISALEENKESLAQDEITTLYEYLIVYLFYVRDIRNNGKGRRCEFYKMFDVLNNKYPELMIKLLEIIPEYGYWKDLNQLYENYFFKNNSQSDKICLKIIELYVEQIKKDIEDYQSYSKDSTEGKLELSLACKWMPKEKRSLDKKTKIYSKISNDIYKAFHPDNNCLNSNSTKKFTRQSIGPIQDAIHTTEKLECEGNFNEINFKFVPGRTLFKKKKAYLYVKKDGSLRGNDKSRMECRQNLLNFIELATQNKVKVHGKTMFIHELCSYVISNQLSEEEQNIINLQYKDHLDSFKKLMIEKNVKLNKGIVLADFSGSMTGSPMDACMAITILLSDLAEDEWKNKFLSFESQPQWISLSYPRSLNEFSTSYYRNFSKYDSTRAGGELTFCEKVKVCGASPWGGSTNFLKAHELMIQVAKQNNLPKEKFPEWFICPSDMQFDSASGNNYNNDWEDNYELLEKMYIQAGYDMPQMIYWNLRSTDTFVTQNRKGVQLMSGFNTNQLKNFLETLEIQEITPWDTFLNAVTDKSYQTILNILRTTNFKPFQKIKIQSELDSICNKDIFENTLSNIKTLWEEGVLSKEDYEKISKELDESFVIVMDD